MEVQSVHPVRQLLMEKHMGRFQRQPEATIALMGGLRHRVEGAR